MISVYRKISGVETEICTLSAKQSEHKTAIRGLNEIQISITVDVMLPILEGDYIKLNGVNYTINRDVEYTIESDVKYSYDFVFEHPFYILLNKLYCNRITGHTSFTLTGKLRDFVELLVWCVNISPENPDGVDTGWTVGEIFNTEYKTLTFQDMYCNEVLNKLSDEFQVEYFFNNKQVNFVERIERLTDHVFEQGSGKGLYKLTQQNVDKEDTVTRLYVRGGNQNVPNEYADEEGYLKLPENYLENFSEHSKVVEKKKKFEEEFPKFIGSVATVSGENNKILTCPAIDFDVSAIAVGDNARINFLSGDLMGVSFKFEWQNTNKQITLIEQEDETALPSADRSRPTIPNSSKKAKIGDTFNFTGVLMPESYVTASITRLREKGNKYLSLFSKKRVKFTLDIDYRYMRNKPTLKVGDLVVISIPEKNFYQVIRITELERNLHTDAISATVSNYLEENWEKYFENKVNDVRNEILAKQANVRNTLETIFKDGIVTESELKIIESVLDRLYIERGQMNAQYLVVRGNINLINKTPLTNAWSAYQTAYTNVTDAINSAIADGKITEAEKNDIDAKLTTYATKLNEFSSALEQARQDIEDYKNQAIIDVTQDNINYLQQQIDGEISNWFYPYSPTLSNYPSSDWTTNTIKDRHIGDTFTNTQQAPAADAGKSWRFVKNGSVYSWTQISDSDAVLALQKAAQAQATADGKSTTFLVQPSNYHFGDTWVLNADRTVNGVAYKQGEILTATQDSATFNQAHWTKKVRYTDDTALNNFASTVYNQDKENFQSQIDGKIETHFTGTDPATAWTTADLKLKHAGDMWYNTTTKKLYRYSGSVWNVVEDQKAIDAFDTASTAKDVADGKRRVFTATPAVPYDVGDLWVQGSGGDIMRCATAKTSTGSYSASDWVKASKYTDDTAVNNLQISSVNLLNNSCDFRESGWNGGWASNAGGYAIDGSVLWNGKPTLRTTVGTGLVHSWLKLENNVEYTYCAMVRTNEDVTWGSVFIPLHYHAGYNNQNQSKINVLKFDTNTLADKWKLIYIIFKLTGDADSFRPHIYRGSGSTVFNFAYIGLVKGNRPLLSPSLSESDKQKLSDEARQTGADAQAAANTANTAVGNLNTYVDGAFQDGVIEASEAKAIEKYINIVNTEKANLEATYNTLYVNAYLEGNPKTNLLNSKVTYFGAVDNLLSAINSAIADGKTTVSEKQNVDAKYNAYKTALASLQTAIENANKAIQDKLDALSSEKMSELQIGGNNLSGKISQYTLGSGWSRTGETLINTNTSTFNHCSSPDFSIEKDKTYILSCHVEEIQGNGIIQPIGTGLHVFKVKQGKNSFSFTAQQNETSHIRVYGNTSQVYKIRDIQVNEAISRRVEEVKLTAEQAQLAADGYMRARYVRDWCKGNTSNNWNAWSEIKVILKNGTNIAQGKPVTGRRAALSSTPYTNVTDGNISTYSNPVSMLTPPESDWVQVDLGAIYYDIDYIQVWHYYQDGRTYYGTKTEISEDGVNWTPVFDSAKSGTYKETAAGKIHSQRYAEVVSKANEAAAKTQYQASIDGGLIYAAIMKLVDVITKTETAGLSGLPGDGSLPAFWAGGTYTQAIQGLAKAIIRHDGSVKFTDAVIEGIIKALYGQIGDMYIDQGGKLYVHDAQSVERLRIGNYNLTPLSVLRAASQTSQQQYFTGKFFSWSDGEGLHSETYTSPETLVLSESEAGSDITVTGNISANVYGRNVNSMVTLLLKHVSGGGNFMVSFVQSDDYSPSNSESVNAVFRSMPAGTYTFEMKFEASYVRLPGNPLEVFSTIGEAKNLKMVSILRNDMKAIHLALDGLMAFYGKNKHLYINDNDTADQAFFNVRGTTNVPGVLCAGRIASNALVQASWGAMKNRQGQQVTVVDKIATGRYRVYHSIGHTDYIPKLTGGVWLYNGNKRSGCAGFENVQAYSFDVFIMTDAGDPVDCAFAYECTGNNWV